jgi:hypothetical protein
MLRSIFVLALGTLLVAVSGCAGHKELKAPCAAEKSASLFSSAAFATEAACGPLIRQDGVSMF